MPSENTKVLSAEQIAAVAKAAGFTGEALTISVAVALAESSGRADVVNYLGCVGLWQIYVKMHPKYTTAQMKNPGENAKAAFAISSGGKNWKPWTTFTGGAYRKHMSEAAKAVIAIPGDNPDTPKVEGPVGKIPGVQTAYDVGASIGGLSATVREVNETIRKGALLWITLIIAMVLLILGIIILNRERVGTVAKVATKVATKI